MMRGFDSIESMNSPDEVLVKRKRGGKKFVVSAMIVGGLFFLVGILIGLFSHESHAPKDNDNTTSPTIAPPPHKFIPEEYIVQNVHAPTMKKELRKWASKERLASTPEAQETSKEIHAIWTSHGLDEVYMESYNVQLSFPNRTHLNKIVLYNKTSGETAFESTSDEPRLRKEDPKTTIPTYNSFCAAGDVSGDAVYANYGRIEDLKYLTEKLSLDLTQKILIVRYGKISSHAKVMNAALFNASGVILYTDPGDTNLMHEDEEPYPSGWWLPEMGVRRESVYGQIEDVDTPGFPAKAYAFHNKESEKKFPAIPCQPISFGDAMHILRELSGSPSPTDWHGTLPIDYRIGPGWVNGTDVALRLLVNNYLDTQTINNVIGIIKGDIEPDRYIILGNHHDSVSFGAVDAASGIAALNQVVSIFAEMLKKGYRPRRTIIFCSWDASEQGHLGSVQWVKDHLKTLQKGGIAYLNVDMVATGHFTISAAASPLLVDAMYEAAKKVPGDSLGAFKNLYELWVVRPNTGEQMKEPKVHFPFASDSDDKVFYQQVGLATSTFSTTYDQMTLNMSTYPLYHTGYDTSHLYENFNDAAFTFTVALTQMWALLAFDLAKSPLIPFKMSRFSNTAEDFVHQILTTYEDSFRENHIETDYLKSAVGNFSKAVTHFENQLSSEHNWNEKPLKLRMINDKLMQLERMFINPEGMPHAPQVKNMIFGNTYLQGIHDDMHLIGEGNESWNHLKEQISLLTFYFQRASTFLGEIGL